MAVMAIAAHAAPSLRHGIAIRGLSAIARPLVCIDAVNDRIYCAGTFERRVTIDRRSVSCAGQRDVFLAAFGADCTLLWLQRIGGEADDSVTCITPLPSGGVALGMMCGGNTADVASYTVGSTTYTGKGSYDAVVTALTTDGAVRWTRTDGAEFSEFPTAITADGTDVYVCGTFVGRSRIGSTVVYDSAATSAYMQRITDGGASAWTVWTRGVVVGAQGRGRAEGGTGCRVVNDTIFATIQASQAVTWGADTMIATSAAYEMRPAVIKMHRAGATTGAVIHDPCRGDSCPTDFDARSATSLVAESQACIPNNEISLVMHRRTSAGTSTTTVFPVGGPASVSMDVMATSPTRYVACGRFERTFAFTSTQLRPDLVADNTALQDGMLIAFRPDGGGLWAMRLGATISSTATSCDVSRRGAIVVAGTLQGAITTDEVTITSDTAATTGFVLAYADETTSVEERPRSDNAQVVGAEVYDLMGRHVSTAPDPSSLPSALPNGLYLVVGHDGLVRGMVVW